jgi:hypothetical protein
MVGIYAGGVGGVPSTLIDVSGFPAFHNHSRPGHVIQRYPYSIDYTVCRVFRLVGLSSSLHMLRLALQVKAAPRGLACPNGQPRSVILSQTKNAGRELQAGERLLELVPTVYTPRLTGRRRHTRCTGFHFFVVIVRGTHNVMRDP